MTNNASNVRAITGNCSLTGATLNVSFNASEIVDHLRHELQNRLNKKGIAVRWDESPQAPELRIQIVQVDEGNQFLRWLMPFIAPAVLEVKGEVAVNGSQPQAFHHVQRAQVGLLGGSARYMLKVCSSRLARNIAQEVPTTAA